jgi:perosamine synthetase
MSLRIPLAKPEITDGDRDAVLQVLRTPQLSMGPKLREFEQALCDYTGSKHAVAMNSGTSALHVAVRALRLERGTEVILPSFTFSALLNVVLQEELQPRFVDIDPVSFNTTPAVVAAAISPRTRLILAVHTFGIPVDVGQLRNLVQRTNSQRKRSSERIHLIEDACEALGADVHGCKAGSFGDAGLFAFYPNKQITTGEGGALLTSDDRFAATAVKLRNQGRDPARGWLQHTDVGFSYRLSDINCALGISQLSRIESIVARRQILAEAYDNALKPIADVIRPPLTSGIGRISWFVYPVQLGPELNGNRDWICESLLKKGIATGRYFAPLHLQPVWINRSAAKNAKDRRRGLANTESVGGRVIALPFFNELSECEIQEVCGALEESIGELRRKT